VAPLRCENGLVTAVHLSKSTPPRVSAFEIARWNGETDRDVKAYTLPCSRLDHEFVKFFSRKSSQERSPNLASSCSAYCHAPNTATFAPDKNNNHNQAPLSNYPKVSDP